MEMVTNALNWFEIPVNDFDRARLFYSKIFDFTMPAVQTGDNMLGIFLYERDKGVGGAIIKGTDQIPSRQGATIYLNGGKNLITVLDRVDAAGGSILTGKTLVAPGVGYIAEFLDTEGNRVGLHSME